MSDKLNNKYDEITYELRSKWIDYRSKSDAEFAETFLLLLKYWEEGQKANFANKNDRQLYMSRLLYKIEDFLQVVSCRCGIFDADYASRIEVIDDMSDYFFDKNMSQIEKAIGFGAIIECMLYFGIGKTDACKALYLWRNNHIPDDDYKTNPNQNFRYHTVFEETKVHNGTYEDIIKKYWKFALPVYEKFKDSQYFNYDHNNSNYSSDYIKIANAFEKVINDFYAAEDAYERMEI